MPDKDLTHLDLIETKQDAYPPEAGEELAEKIALVTPEIEVREARHTQWQCDLTESGKVLAAVEQRKAQLVATLNSKLLAGYQENIALGESFNASEFVQGTDSLQKQIDFHTGTTDLLRYRIIPRQILGHLKSDWNAKEAIALKAMLEAQALEAETLKRLESVYKIQGRVGFLGGHSETLNAAHQECRRQVLLAREALRVEVARQRTVESQRKSCGLVTKAEILLPAPCFDECYAV